jgi:GntR family transcriptional regulator/MocR family aminotransferase
VAKHAELVPFISIALAAGEGRPLYRQLYDALRTAILDERLPPGQRLPSTRALADLLHVSRFTVATAYELLLAEEFIHGQVGSGTYVRGDLVRAEGALPAERRPPGSPPRLSERGLLLASTRVTTDGDLVGPRAFSPGQPALDYFPSAVWARIAGRVLRRPPPELLAYGDTRGYRPLREAIASYLRAARGVSCDPEQVFVVSGSQQALDLSARILLDPGDAVWIEDPGYLGARAALRGAGADLVPVNVDDEGIDVAEGVRRRPNARLAYVTPSYQYPLGVTMSLARRLALLDWARSASAWVLEDDYDSEFRYAGHPLAALAGLDTAGHVIYMGTFSKVLFPALRLGYLVVPSWSVDAFAHARASTGRHAPTLDQAVLAEFIAEGHFAHHLRAMRVLYHERQKAFLATVSSGLAGLIDVRPSAAGMHLVGWLAASLDDVLISRRAAEAGIDVRPISAHALGCAVPPGLLLGYTALRSQETQDGLATLARVLSG